MVRPDGTGTRLTELDCSVLSCLLRAAGEPVSRTGLALAAWGEDHAPSSRAVDLAVRRLRKKIEEHPAFPVSLVTVYGVGYRLVLPGPAVAGPPGDPIPSGALIGRDRDVGEVRQLLRTARVVTLHGPGGVGKSTLARGVLGQEEGAWEATAVVELEACRGAEELRVAVSRSLGAPLDSGSPAAQLTRMLAARGRLLLVLDGVERSTDVLADMLPTWLRAAPGLHLLLTSRRPLDVRDETVHVVRPLDTDSALTLFERRSRTTLVGTPAEDACRALVAALDGLPLAVELAAARTRTLAVEELLERIDDRLAWLRRPGRGADPNNSVEASLARSWEDLSRPARDGLLVLGEFEAAFPYAAAEAVIPGAPLDVIDELVAGALVQREARSLRLLDTVRAFSRARAAETRRTAVSEAVRTWLLAEGARLADRLERGADAEAARELGRMEADLFRLAAGGGPDDRARVAVALYQARLVYGGLDALIDLISARGEGIVDVELRFRARLVRGRILVTLGRLDDAEAELLAIDDAPDARGALAVALALAEVAARRTATPATDPSTLVARAVAIGDHRLVVEALLQASAAAWRASQLTDAARLGQEAVARARLTGDPRLVVRALAQLAIRLTSLDRARDALGTIDEALAIARELDHPRTLQALYSNAAVCAYGADEPERATQAAWRELELARQLGDRHAEAVALGHLGTVSETLQIAEERFRQARALARDHGDEVLLARASGNLAVCIHLQGRFADAVRAYLDAAEVMRGASSPHVRVRYLAWLALAAWQGGDGGLAREQLGAAEQLAEEVSPTPSSFLCALVRARIEQEEAPEATDSTGDVTLTRRLIALG